MSLITFNLPMRALRERLQQYRHSNPPAYVYIAVLNQGWIRPELANFLVAASHDRRFIVKITYPDLKPISHNRNQIVKDFLKEPRFEFLLMIDSDVVPLSNVLELTLLGKDVIAAPCPQWRSGDIYWVVVDKIGDGYQPVPPDRRQGLQEVSAVGTGCIAIRYNVLREIRAPFEREWNEDGTQKRGLDFYFCDKARAAGFKIWAHWDYPCSHFKEIDLVAIPELVEKYKEASRER